MNDVTAPISVEALTATLAEATETNKTNAANYKQAKAYTKSMVAHAKVADEDGQAVADADVGTATQTEAGWKAAVEAGKEAVKTAKAALAQGKKDAKAASKPAKVAKEVMPTQNGMTQPRAGTSSDTLWAVYDAAMVTKGSAPALEEVMDEARGTGITDGTIKAAYAHWRKFNGITGRVVSAAKLAAKEADEKAKVEAATAKAAAKAAKDAANAQAKLDKAAVAVPVPAEG